MCSAHFKPEDMFKTITGLTRLKHRSLHGPRRVKSADKTNCRDKKILRKSKQKRSDVNSLLIQSGSIVIKKLLAESSIER